MQRSNFLFWAVAVILFILTACSGTKRTDFGLDDLNGTWESDWVHEYKQGIPKSEYTHIEHKYSWGIGLMVPHSTFEVDVSADRQFFIMADLGIFDLTQIKKESRDTISMLAYRGDLDGPEEIFKFTISFQFIDRNTIRVSCKDLLNDDGIAGLWYRLSGPGFEY